MNITLKDVPDSLHQKLREAAELSGRSLSKLILFTLEQEFCAHKSDRVALMDRIRSRREGMKVWIDDHSLENATNEDRP